MTIVRLEDIPPISVAGVNLHAVRRTLGVTAFGINAYSADAGALVIEEHDEAGGGAGKHEELYVVLRGRATFSLDGDERDAPAGTFVFVPEVTTVRKAVAAEDGTVVLALGGPAGAAMPPSAWEYAFLAQGEKDPEKAYEVAAEGLHEHPEHAALQFNLACFASLAGMRDVALAHLHKAFELDPKTRDWAETDTDLDAIRDGF